MQRTQCMNCGAETLSEFIDLEEQPNGNNFPLPDDAKNEMLFPIVMLVCESCWQVQIGEMPSQEFLFSNHPYVTGANVPIVEHFERLSKRIVEKLDLAPNSLVIDIGANDGTLLRAFESLGMRTLGVDPGRRTGELAAQQGTTVLRTFWNKETGQSLNQLGVRPAVIMATAVFYHLPDLHDFIEGLKLVMCDDAVFVVQCVNLLDLIEKNQFDHFYHEHSCIHSIAPLERLFRERGMRILDVENIEIHGGSFVATVGLDSHSKPTNDSVAKAIAVEKKHHLDKVDTYREFAKRVETNGAKLIELLTRLKEEGKTVYALGAPVKGNTLLNYCNVGPDLVQCATEVNQFKIGTVTPGMHIPVVDESEIDEQPDYYLVLSWNFIDFLVGKYKGYLMDGGKFIVPVPSVHILGFEAVSP